MDITRIPPLEYFEEKIFHRNSFHLKGSAYSSKIESPQFIQMEHTARRRLTFQQLRGQVMSNSEVNTRTISTDMNI